MFEKIKVFLKGKQELAKKSIQEPVQPVVATETSKAENQPKQQNTMDLDEKVLRCFVLYSEYIDYSTGPKCSCFYVYVKPGRGSFSKNIDFVQEVYALNNIKLNKHISHLNGKETEVLYISMQSYMENLDDIQKQFFKRTAPEVKQLSDYRWSNESVIDRAHDINVKIGIERGIIDPKVWEEPIRLPYNNNNGR